MKVIANRPEVEILGEYLGRNPLPPYGESIWWPVHRPLSVVPPPSDGEVPTIAPPDAIHVKLTKIMWEEWGTPTGCKEPALILLAHPPDLWDLPYWERHRH